MAGNCLKCVALLAAVLAGGCVDRPDFETVYPVSGAVFVGGKPAEGAMVTFHPAAEVDDPRARRSIATVAQDGSFAMTTYYPGDGVPPGQYVVTLNWPAELPPNAHPTEVAPDRLRGRFSSPSKPLTRVTVEEKATTLAPFQIPK